MRPIPTLAGVVCLALAGPACGDKKDGGKTEEPPPAEETAPADAAAPAEPPAEEVEVPTAADFEQEADDQITEDNLEKQVEAIEKEVTEDTQ